MARPPDASLPDVVPTENVPTPYQRLQTPVVPPRQYSQALGEGEQKAGQQLERLGEHFGKIVADDATNQWMEKAEQILHGDPNVKNPDGSQDQGYMGTRGEASLNERAAYEKRFDDLTKDARGKLVTFDQKAQFDQMTRRMRAVYSGQMGTHANTQALTYGDSVYTNQIKDGLDKISTSPMDNAVVAEQSARVREGFAKKFQLHGLSPGEAIREADQAIAVSRIMSIGVKDKALAGQIADHEQGVLGTKYPEIKRHFEAEEQQEGAEKMALDAAGSVGLGSATATGPVRPQGTAPQSAAPGSLSPVMQGVKDDLFGALKAQGVDLYQSSGRRPGAGTGRRQAGPPPSRHETGDAIDVTPPGGGVFSDDQMKKIVAQALKDPRIKGFEYDPTPGNEHFHFDVRGPNEPRVAFGHDGSTSSAGKNWPAWMTQQVQEWAGQRPPMLTNNMANADAALRLTPQEKYLYQQHLDNLGKGGVVHRDRSVSTLLQTVEEHNGRYYNVPTIWNNEMLWDDKENKPDRGAVRAEVEKVGWDKFPSYPTPEAADARYQQMHEYMDRDTQMPPTLAQTVKSEQAEVARRSAYAIEKVIRGPGTPLQKRQALALLDHLRIADQLKITADEKQKQDADDQASKFYTDLMMQPGMHPNILAAINKDDRLQKHTKVQLNDLVRKLAVDPQAAHARDFGAGFDNVMKRIALKPGDPDRIADNGQLLEMYNSGALTLPGFHQAAGILTSVKKENDYGKVQMTNSFAERAKGRLTFHGEGGNESMHIPGLQDLKGLDDYAVKFLPQLYKDLAKWEADPKNPGITEFFTPKRLDDMTRAIRTPEQMAQDKLRAAGTAPDQPVPPPPPNFDPNGWSTLMKHPPVGMPLQNWARILTRLGNDPSDVHTSDFDKFYTPLTGTTSEEALRFLKTPDRQAPIPEGQVPGMPPAGVTLLTPAEIAQRTRDQLRAKKPPPAEERP